MLNKRASLNKIARLWLVSGLVVSTGAFAGDHEGHGHTGHMDHSQHLERLDQASHGAHEDHSAHAAMLEKQNHYSRSLHEYNLPDVTLVNQFGEKVSLWHELAPEGDETVVVSFIFTTCTTICPVLTSILAQTQKELGPEVENLQMISISIDPEYDTPVQLDHYARRFKAKPQWHFLTGNLADIVAVQRAFDAYRGDKMNHLPLTFLRFSPASPWIRLEGFPSAADLVSEYRALQAG